MDGVLQAARALMTPPTSSWSRSTHDQETRRNENGKIIHRTVLLEIVFLRLLDRLLSCCGLGFRQLSFGLARRPNSADSLPLANAFPSHSLVRLTSHGLGRLLRGRARNVGRFVGGLA